MKVPNASHAFSHDPEKRLKEAPAGDKGKGSDVGGERRADVRGTQEGGSRAEAGGTKMSLKAAVHELHEQHPHHHSAGGIHGTKDHIRHKPMGLK